MSHIPVNHPMRTFYRFLATVTGLYVLVFGVVGFTRTSGSPAFSQENLPTVLGLRTNLAFAVLSVVVGAVIVASSVIGRNIDRFVDIAGGLAFMGVGTLMMILMRTDANFLGFEMANVIVSYVIGSVLFSAGLYARTGSVEHAAAEERARHHGVGSGASGVPAARVSESMVETH